MPILIVITAPADGCVLFSAKASASAVVTKFGSFMYFRLALVESAIVSIGLGNGLVL